MEGLGNILAGKIPAKRKKRGINHPLAARAAELADATGVNFMILLRWLKNHEWAVERAFIEMKSANARNKTALFIFLFKKYKDQNDQSGTPQS